MHKTILIGDKNVEMEANAATPFRFKSVFKKDLLKIMSTTTDETGTDQMEAGQMLAYIMAKQAERVDMTKLTEETFYIWLEDFMSNDMYDCLNDCVDLWQASQKTSSTPKK